MSQAPPLINKPTGPEVVEATTASAQEDFEPKIYGESAYDRVSAVVLGALIVFGWLSIIAATTSAYQSRVSQSIQVIEVSGGGGGSPDGKVNSIEEVNVAGGESSDKASNNEDDASEFEEPSVEARPAAMLDTVAEAGQNLAEVDVSAVMPGLWLRPW
jgi:hypothetical protein